MDVDGLVASKNQHLTLIAQCVERIKEHSTRSHIERLDHVAFPDNRSRIASASLGARPGGWSTDQPPPWLAATKVRPPSFHVLSKTTSSNGASSITFAPAFRRSQVERCRLSPSNRRCPRTVWRDAPERWARFDGPRSIPSARTVRGWRLRRVRESDCPGRADRGRSWRSTRSMTPRPAAGRSALPWPRATTGSALSPALETARCGSVRSGGASRAPRRIRAGPSASSRARC